MGNYIKLQLLLILIPYHTAMAWNVWGRRIPFMCFFTGIKYNYSCAHKQCTYQLVECTKEHNVDKCNQWNFLVGRLVVC